MIVEKRDVVRRLLAQIEHDEFRGFFAQSLDFAKGFDVAGCDCHGERFKVVTAENLHCHFRTYTADFYQTHKQFLFFQT